MLKTYSTSLLFPKRLTLASAVKRFENNYSTDTAGVANMSTDATLPTPPPSQQPMLASQRAKQQQQAQDDSNKTPRVTNAYFPLGYKDAAYQWWTSVSSKQAERHVLSYVPFLREAANIGSSESLPDVIKSDPFGVERVWRSSMVQLSGKNRALNELSIERVGEQTDDTLVMLHGYGAGLGFFYKNFEPLSRVKGWKLYALDMLGMGNSARPSFKIHAKEPQEKIREAESWFIDALEEWRQARKIEKFTLLGHSMGGYLAVSYALKYPGHLNKLILASPVGIPEDPWAVNAEMPEPEESTFANEFTQDQESIVQQEPAGNNANYIKASNKKGAAANPKTVTTPPRRPIPGWVSWLWDANVSPFSIIRLAGPLGPRFVSGWTSRRFNHLPPDEKEALHTYSYSLFRQRGSGEYALPYLLAPGAYARSPVINRIQEVGRQIIKSSAADPETPPARETGFPIVMMYGDNDWMDVAGGFAAEEKIKARVVKALLHGTEEEKRRENGSAKVIIVSKAGHHLYLDNPDEFNEYIRKEMEETSKWTQKQKTLQQ
ncbi:putative cardiolipin-specific deacylase, mitochondrial [Diplogelasinospora grovesii]|uniref:Cardiolipin-specific deacylase, mitochondrial n=1 Tax=Diplogelasinospora grovesii TaxID=303347 RepID=A0AAN6S3K0_9PEZI|nr:putative cardiolipin-specific deacylase, mitochondrial [Diplogelasinospora grovesii]